VLSRYFVDSDPDLIEDVVLWVCTFNLKELIEHEAWRAIEEGSDPDRPDGDKPAGWRGGVHHESVDLFEHMILRREEGRWAPARCPSARSAASPSRTCRRVP
jgi:hypothetical protein